MSITIHEVIPNHTTKIRKKVMIKMEVMGTYENVTFLEIEKLREAGILGTDFLDNQCAKINYHIHTLK